MQLIPIGAKHIGYIDGIESKPRIFLFSSSSRKYYEATVSDAVGGVYTYTFSAETTQLLLPGVYGLQVFNQNFDELIASDDEYGKAIVVATSSSQGSEDGDPQE